MASKRGSASTVSSIFIFSEPSDSVPKVMPLGLPCDSIFQRNKLHLETVVVSLERASGTLHAVDEAKSEHEFIAGVGEWQ